MRLRHLGRHGPEISVIGYGAWEIGGQAYGPNPTDKEVIGTINAALDAGVNWIDTAEIYGNGLSEQLVGKAISGRRHEVLIATKVAPRPVGTGFSPKEIRRAAEQSLRRLGIEHIDLYQLHWFPNDSSWPIEETWEAMIKLVDDGVVSHIGVSNFDRSAIERCLPIRHVDSLQPQFSMLHREREQLIAWCGDEGIGVVVYGPLAYGLLTGTINSETKFEPDDWRSGRQPDDPYYKDLFAPGRIERNLRVVEGLGEIAGRLNITPGQLALAWVLQSRGVTSAIAGSRNADHNRENAAAGELSLPQEVMDEIESIL